MANVRIRPQRCVLLILLFSACACAAQRHGIADFDKAAPRNHINRLPFIIPRGGDNELIEEVSDTIHDAFMDVAIAPWIQKHTVLIFKILAYCGVIGDKGEGLLEWAEDNKSGMQSTLRKLLKVIRIRLEKMLIAFANLPDRAQFVTCVSIGASVFPLTVKTVAVTSLVTLAGFVVAEALNHVGVLGDVGEEIQEWMEESETMIKSFKRWMNQKRKIMRKQLNIEELFKAVYKSLGKDRVFWAGIGVGAIASVVLDNEKATQALDVSEDKLIK